MNTLPVEYRERFIKTSSDLHRLRRAWRSHRGLHTGTHHLIYLAVQGKDWRKAFGALVNPRKVANGGYYTWGLRSAVRQVQSYRARLHHNRERRYLRTEWAQERYREFKAEERELLAPFGGLVTPEILLELGELLPKLPHFSPGGATDYRPDAFEAYILPEETAERLAEWQQHLADQKEAVTYFKAEVKSASPQVMLIQTRYQPEGTREIGRK
jgi:hypothetical protein